MNGTEFSVQDTKMVDKHMIHILSHANAVKNEILLDKTNLITSIYLQSKMEAPITCKNPSTTPLTRPTNNSQKEHFKPIPGLVIEHAEISTASTSMHVPPIPPNAILTKSNVPNPYPKKISDLSESIQVLV